MNIALIKNPSIALWKNELELILSNKRNLELRKLGSAGAYIENTFIHSVDKLYSISCFKEAFNELIHTELQQDNPSKETIEFIISVIDKFKSNTDINTASTFYLNFITDAMFIIIHRRINIFEYENSFFTYCVYLNFILQQDKLSFLCSSAILGPATEILYKIIGLSDRISSFALFLIFCLDVPNPIDFDSIKFEIGLNVLRYSIAKQITANSTVNEFIVEFAIKYPDVFKQELHRINCELSGDCNSLIYRDGFVRRDLEPSLLNWEKLIDIYNGPHNYSELLQRRLNTAI